MEYKFDEASLKDDIGNIIDPPLKLEYLNKIKNNNNYEYMQKYERKLFCPECHQPQLSLVTAPNGTCHLRKFPKQDHLYNCSYSFNPVNKIAVTELLQSIDSCRFVNTKLKGLIESLFKRLVKPQNPVLVKMEQGKISTNNINQQDLRNQQSNNIRRLPTKSLTATFDLEDYDTPKFFYGNVDIEFCEKENKNTSEVFYVLIIYTKGSKHKICNITMSEAVFSHLQSTNNIKDISVIHNNVIIALATKLTKNGQYVNGRLVYSDYCVIASL